MKRLLILASLSLLLFYGCNCGNNKDKNQTQVINNESEAQDVDAILASPDDYAGHVVRVKGLVTHVCKHSGQRLHLSSPDSENWVRVEAAGNIKNFQRELEGSSILVEGEFKKQVIDEDYLSKWENEMASKGENHDHSESTEESEQITNMRKRLENSGKDQLVSYWVDGTSFKVN